jgi:UDP-2,3-diacylglucosamine pyrophosphatase LpxH
MTSGPRWLAVISDLHISEGQLDDFDDELEGKLVEFLEWLGEHPEPAELVINGDFLDFVQASPWRGRALEAKTPNGTRLCFTEEQSLEKLANIERAHRRTFDALKAFLADEKNRLTILPGNHDPDFFWPSVQKRFACLLGAGSSRLQFCLERSYRPKDLDWLLIEHGHQYDKVNSFYIDGHEHWSAQEPPILKGQDGKERLYECIGTRFLIRYLNGLDARYPYVDNVKPFSRFLSIFGASALTPGWGPLDAAISVSGMLAFVSRALATGSGDLMGIDVPIRIDESHPLLIWINSATDEECRKLNSALRNQGFELAMPLKVLAERPEDRDLLVKFLAENPGLLSGLGERDPSLLGSNEGTLSLREAYKANETLDLYDGAVNAALGTINTVIMGHTHEPFERRQHGLSYFNTGSWTRYYRFAEDEKTKPWQILADHSYETFPYWLRYVLVRPGNKAATVETWCERTKS